MERVKLSSILNEVFNRSVINNQYNVLTSSQNGLIEQDLYFNKQIASKENIGYKIIKKGQYTYRSMSDTGLFFINRLKHLDYGIISPSYPVFEIKSNKVLPEYLDLYFKSNLFQYQINNFSRGTTRLALKYNKLITLEVLIPSIEKQRKVIDEINKINEIKRYYENNLILCDNIVKSQFIEMFIYKNYTKESLKDLAIGKAEYGASSASIPYVEGRPRYVRITDINDDGTLNDCIVCSINEHDDINYKLSYGDFLFARMGATVGKTYAFFEGLQIYAGYLIRYRLNTMKINPKYLFYFTKLDEYLLWVKNNQSGVAQPGINVKKYDSLKIPVPPIELQNEFAHFVQQIDKSKYFGDGIP